MIVLVDPGMNSTNVGDQIISEAVNKQFVEPARSAGKEVVSIPMHGGISDASRAAIERASDVVVSGTNLLSDHMRFRRAWQWDRSDIELTRGKLTAFGVGWWQYQRAGIDPLSAAWLRSLAGGSPWAVRDEYSADRLNRAGVEAVHASCPTLWNCEYQTMPGGNARVVVTLTDYNQERSADQHLVSTINAMFDDVLFWPQGPGDRAYILSLSGTTESQILPPTLEGFDNALKQSSTAYVGLRLHGGIRAMQFGVPSLILSVDNRAREIAKSVGLVAPSRHAIGQVADLLRSESTHRLRLPSAAIEGWRSRWIR